MADEAENMGLRPVGDPPIHADDRPVNDSPDDTVGEGETGLAPRGEAPDHTSEFSEIQTSRRGGGAAGSAVRAEDNPQPADE